MGRVTPWKQVERNSQNPRIGWGNADISVQTLLLDGLQAKGKSKKYGMVDSSVAARELGIITVSK